MTKEAAKKMLSECEHSTTIATGMCTHIEIQRKQNQNVTHTRLTRRDCIHVCCSHLRSFNKHKFNTYYLQF